MCSALLARNIAMWTTLWRSSPPAAAKYLEPMAQLSKKIYRRTFRQNHLHVYTAVYHQLLHQLLRVLRFPYQQPDGTYHPHPPNRLKMNTKPSRNWGLLRTCYWWPERIRQKPESLIWLKLWTSPKKYFSNLKIEVMPLKAEEYAELKEHGLNGVICFQETYNKARYNIYHPRGMKSKFEWRVNGFDRMGQAGVHSIGMGVLIGLEEWRTDVTMMAYHLRYLQKKYWKTKYSVNFPPYASGRKRWFPAECHHEWSWVGTAHFCHAYFRSRC